MTPFASPASDTQSRPAHIHTRIKWDNLAIVAAGTLLALGAALWILIGASNDAPLGGRSATPTPAGTTIGDDVTKSTGPITLDDATSLVEEARALMGEARWDEAADRLASIPRDLRSLTEADSAQMELDGKRGRHEQLTTELTAQVEAQRWSDASATLDALERIAKFDDKLLATRALVRDRQSRAAATPLAANATGAKATTAAGSGAATTTANGASRSTAAPTATATTATQVTTKPTVTKPAASTTGASTAVDVDALVDDLGSTLDTSELSQLTNLLGSGTLSAAKLAKLQQALEAALTPADIAALNAALRDVLA